MSRSHGLLLAGALAASIAGFPALAAPGEACLQNNRIWSWNALDERTLIVTDRNNKRFVVRLSGGCTGLTTMIPALAFRTWTSLGCLERGDRVSFREPTLGPMSCFVREVLPYDGGPHDEEVTNHSGPPG